jgi:hypothetical protein
MTLFQPDDEEAAPDSGVMLASVSDPQYTHGMMR